jgi:hypothetical protein
LRVRRKLIISVGAITAFAAMTAAGAQRARQPQATPSASISIEDVDARATISGCLAREASASGKAQPVLSDTKVLAEVGRQAKDPKRLERCRQILAGD